MFDVIVDSFFRTNWNPHFFSEITGHVGGSMYSDIGGGSNYLCLPPEP